jgi:hypothetical protein
MQGQKPSRGVEEVNVFETGNAQFHNVRVFKQYQRHKGGTGRSRQRCCIFVNRDFAEVRARFLRISFAAALIAHAHMGLDNIDLIVKFLEASAYFARGSFWVFVIS